MTMVRKQASSNHLSVHCLQALVNPSIERIILIYQYY